VTKIEILVNGFDNAIEFADMLVMFLKEIENKASYMRYNHINLKSCKFRCCLNQLNPRFNTCLITRLLIVQTLSNTSILKQYVGCLSTLHKQKRVQ
jgi:hypothetical protein